MRPPRSFESANGANVTLLNPMVHEPMASLSASSDLNPRLSGAAGGGFPRGTALEGSEHAVHQAEAPDNAASDQGDSITLRSEPAVRPSASDVWGGSSPSGRATIPATDAAFHCIP